MNKTTFPQIETLIYTIRGYRVMLDHDLARLYGVETGALNRSVKRNLERFPYPFTFQLDEIETKSSRCQFGILNKERGKNIKYRPYAFTELGIAMLSSVLRSEQAIQVHISIIRTFFELRNLLREHSQLSKELSELKHTSNSLFKLVFERLDDLENTRPPFSPQRRKIGI